MVNDESARGWETVVAPPRSAPGVISMVGYRALNVPDGVHLGMPSSTLTFIVGIDDGVRTADTPEALGAATPIPLVLGGLHLRATLVRQLRRQAGVQLAVHPLASRALFGVPSAELAMTDFDGTSVLGRRGVELRDRAAEAGEWQQVFGLVAGYLVDARRRRAPAVRSGLSYAWHLLERSRGRIPVGSVAEQVGLSPRHLNTLFRREVGRSPKTVAMLMRFEHATARIAEAARRHGRVDLAGVAADTGFSDQAHLTREFVRFAGVSPRAWLVAEFRNIQDGGTCLEAGSEHDYFDRFEPDRLVDYAGSGRC